MTISSILTTSQPEDGLAIRSVERAVDVLTYLGRADAAASVTDMQRVLGLSRPTLYRLLHTLEKKGLVRSVGDPQRFQLDYRVVELSSAWLGRNDVVSVAQRHLSALWRDTDETVAMFVPGDPSTKVCVQEMPSRQALVFTRGVGFTEPMTVGSSGKAILAFMPAADIEAVLAATAEAAERSAIRRDIETIRCDGYSISTGEIIAGAVSMAAPVFGRGGAVAASISLFGPEARITGEHRAACLGRLRQAAREISMANGHRPATAAE